MKTWVALAVILLSVVQAQSLQWKSVGALGYLERSLGLGVLTRTASPGDESALVFDYDISSSSVSGYCEYIIYTGVRGEDLYFKKRRFFAYIPSSQSTYNLLKNSFNSTNDSTALLNGISFCIYAQSQVTPNGITELEYTIPTKNPDVRMNILYGTNIHYGYDTINNTVRLEVTEAASM